ncbi:MAG: hypothetical protein EO766_08015 [Hydrotalea sp. AMD]|uniref:GNVR domain-containing protein n=1 Tax=Hydrotalea sp. AMD TaxID=2501297 RepID=UPI001025BF34|nr:GNVR domain-containing protein [Hydrotalea sp. AMD]RWZ88326.1 MAG: hypothetical protein EO766_08015 [Hydrotalea sp. AMD]
MTQTTEPQEEYYSLADILQQVKAFLRYLRQQWVWLLIAAVLGIGGGVLYYYLQKPAYQAEETFILEEKTPGGGGLAGLASQFGFDVGSLTGSSSIFSGDNILDILNSRRIVEHVLLSKVDSSQTNGPTLADVFLDFSKLKKAWRHKPGLDTMNFYRVNGRNSLSLLQDSILHEVYKQVTKKYVSVSRLNKKGTIITVTATSINPDFSLLLARRMVKEASDLYIDIKTSVSASNVNRLQQKADSLLALLNNKSYQVAGMQINDANPALKSVLVPTELASRDRTVLATLYTEVVKNLETVRTTLMLQTPVIEVLDMPHAPLEDGKKKLSFTMIIGFIIGVLIGVGYVFIRYLQQHWTIEAAKNTPSLS